MRLINKPIKLNNVGDTIVEVLIVLAVLGLAFSISTATASKGLGEATNSQEHSRALGEANSQIELLRAAISTQTALPQDRSFCMNGETPVPFTGPTLKVPDDAEADSQQTSMYPAECRANDPFFTSVTFNTDGFYEIRVRWDGIGSFGRQQEYLAYRITPLDLTPNSGTNLTENSTRIVVNVIRVNKPSSDPRDLTPPNCSGTNTSGAEGIALQLTGPGKPTDSRTTDASGSITFNNLTDFLKYQAHVQNFSASGNDNYTNCPGGQTQDRVALPGGNNTVEFRLLPKCEIRTITDPATPIYGNPQSINWGHQPIYDWRWVPEVINYGPWYSYYVQGYRTAYDRWLFQTVDNFVFLGQYWKRDYTRSRSGGAENWYNTWEAVLITTRDEISRTPGYWEQYIRDYTPDDWRPNIIGWQPNSHQEMRCYPNTW